MSSPGIAHGLTRELSRHAHVVSRLGLTQALRLAYLAYARTLGREAAPDATPEAIRCLRARLAALFDQDFRDAEEGLYPRELIRSLRFREYASAAPRLLFDLPRTRQRILENRFDDLDDAAHARYPSYYARNFHFQTDGYLGHTSAQLYDLQVELLFGGTADVMRRRLVPPVVRFAREQAGAAQPPRILDVACGTGHLLGMLGAALPRAQLCGVDLSPHYIARARSTLPSELDVSLLVENAEQLPFEDGRFDAVTCLFLFHELPGDVRARVLGEIARVVRPGGLVVLGDSVQICDSPLLEGELTSFPRRYHEPYYLGYVRDDLSRRAREAGLSVLEEKPWFVTKVVVARKPEAARA